MPRPANWKPYTKADGTEVPSVTTVIGNRRDAGGLLWWNWDQGRKGIPYNATRDAEAEAGTLAHAAVEAWIRKREFTWPAESEIVSRARTAFGAFELWARQTALVVTDPEVRLVSETHSFGGTTDGVTAEGKRAVLDWKAAGGLYVDHVIQVRAYQALWDENHPDDPIVGGLHVVRFDKTHGDFHHHHWPNLDMAWEAFLLLRRMYDIDRSLKARVK